MAKKSGQVCDVIVIGAGPSGMMAALTAASEGASVLLLEKKEILGKKLLLTGHGRCNITNIRIMDNFRETYHENARFLTSALHAFSPEDVRGFFAALGVPTHEEDAGRIFPDTEKAVTVRDSLATALSRKGVEIVTEAPVKSIGSDPQSNLWYVTTEKDRYLTRSVIIATGGKSFTHTGSEGDGYELAKKSGHSVTELTPALAPLFLSGLPDMAGITLPDVGTSLTVEGKKPVKAKGDLLFTHQGVSGPAAMSLSRKLPPETGVYPKGKVRFSIDMLPDLREEDVAASLLSAMNENPNRHMKRILCETFHLQEKAAVLVLDRSGVTEDPVANQVTKEVRKKIAESVKNSAFDVEKCTPLDMAYVTCGGVSVQEIDPKTMGSKIREGLFFAGEVMDVDGVSGGYNLQCAWATGRAAGRAAVEYAATRKQG